MMKFIKSVFIFLFIFVSFISSQNITDEEKALVLAELNKPETTSLGIFYNVIKNNIYEAIPIIEDNFWDYGRLEQTLALKALARLGAENTKEFATQLLDTLNSYPEHLKWKTLDNKVYITETLCELGDFSTVEYAFEMLENSKEQEEITIDHIMFMIVKNYPPYEDRARLELENNVLTKNDIHMFRPLRMLEEAYGEEIIPFMTKGFKEAQESATRLMILNQNFSKYSNKIDLQSILREQLYQDTSSTVRSQIAKVLLFGVGGSSNYKYVKDYISNETDPTVESLLKYKINSYRPNSYDSTLTTSTMIDTLTSYKTQCFDYEWLQDENYKNELLTKLSNAKNYLNSADSSKCKAEVVSFQNSVNQVYQDSAGSYPKYVSDEGYKFLFHFAQYIVDRQP